MDHSKTSWSRWAVLQALMGLSWLAFVMSVVGRSEPGRYHALYDAGLYNVPFGVVAVTCWLRAARREADWRAWQALAVGFVLFVLGNLYGSLVVGDREIYPSPADGLWLSYYVAVYVAVGRLVGSRCRHFQPSTWLDGAVGGLGAAGLVVAFALGPTLAMTEGSLPVVATNLAYPTADILLIVILVASGTGVGARDPSFWLLGAGIALLCLTDIVFLFQESAGTYAEGGLLDVCWPLAAVLMGFAACSRGPGGPSSEARQRFVIPVTFATASVALLGYGQRHHVPLLAVALAIAALVATALRVALTVREVKALAESRREARTDELTGLANRRLLVEELAGALERTDEEVALVMIDLDGFKEVNDSLGHGAGDQLLAAVGRRFALVAPPGSVLARLGGDEFSIVLAGHPSETAMAVAGRLRGALAEPFALQEARVVVDASVGVACSPVHGTTAEDLLAHADISMFRAKRQRTGVELFNPDRDTPSRDRLELVAELRAAFNQSQFVLHYQPQLDLGSGRIRGVEALVRWQHPRRGLLAPDMFLPIVEQSNQMMSLTRLVLRRALADCAELHRAGFPLRMSVNVSASDLVSDSLTDGIAGLLTEYSLAPDALVIEVTENSVMTDRLRSLRTLHQIRRSGVHISVDDYGTGQASLSYIRDLPVTEIKLDRSFLQGVPADTHNAAIVRSTIELAHTLELPIVAEGVEDAAALDWLRALGCDLGQGFHISRPVPYAELLALLHGEDDRSATPTSAGHGFWAPFELTDTSA